MQMQSDHIDANDSFEVHMPPRRSIIFIALLALLVAFALFVTVATWEDDSYYMLMGLLSTLFCSMGFIFLLYRMIKKKPVLTVDAEGFYDRSSMIAAGRIGWNEVTDIQLQYVNHQHLITFHLHDPEGFLARQSFIKRWVIKLNANGQIVTVNISSLMLDQPVEWVYDQMMLRYNLWANNGIPPQEDDHTYYEQNG